jgi:hypothetical protein
LTCNRFGFFTLNFVQKKKRENGKKWMYKAVIHLKAECSLHMRNHCMLTIYGFLSDTSQLASLHFNKCIFFVYILCRIVD